MKTYKLMTFLLVSLVLVAMTESGPLTIAALALKGIILLQLTLLALAILLPLGKRSVSDEAEKREQLQMYSDLAKNMDHGHCLPRIVCETMAKSSKGSRGFNNLQKIILQYYDNYDRKFQSHPELRNLTSIYNQAAQLGLRTGSELSCLLTYNKCYLSSESLYQATILPSTPICL